jgi:hypothetical protein
MYDQAAAYQTRLSLAYAPSAYQTAILETVTRAKQ